MNMMSTGNVVDQRPLDEAIAAIERRAESATEAETEAAHARLGSIIDATEGDDSREARIKRHRASLEYVCLIGFEGAPREALWRIVNKLGALLGKTGLDREPYVRQQLAAALAYIAEGSQAKGFDVERDGWMLIAAPRASIVAEPDNFPTLWCRDSGSDWAEYSSEDMSPEARQAFFGSATAQLTTRGSDDLRVTGSADAQIAAYRGDATPADYRSGE
jgi:hypothetical protein